MEGRLAPGVLAAAQKVLANAQANPSTDPDVLRVRAALPSGRAPTLAAAR